LFFFWGKTLPNKILTGNTLQTKLLVSVFIIVSLTIVCITAVVNFIVKKQFQQTELNRIYYESNAFKNRLGQLMYNQDHRSLMVRLSNAKTANPAILYFLLTDKTGTILIADNETRIGQNQSAAATVQDKNDPVYTNSARKGESASDPFKVYLSRLTTDIYDKGAIKGRNQELIFDAVWEIFYMGAPMGELRVGFSRHGMKQHLWMLTGILLGTGFLVLLVTLFMIFWVIRLNMSPLASFVGKLSLVHKDRGGQNLRNNLARISLEETETEVDEIRDLKSAFLNIRDLFVLNWDQLEDHRRNLEQMVAERTAKFHEINEQLALQVRERKVIESRLLTVQKLEAIGTLAGGIAHEFNNLFMAITGYATLIQKQAEPGHSNIEKAEKIRQLVDTGSQSIQQLLGFARSGKYDPGPLNLNGVLRQNLLIFSRSRKDLEIQTTYCADLWSVQADRSQMEQVIMNLLLNASEAMPGKGCLQVETRNVVLNKKSVSLEKKVSGRFVLFCIKDEGRGIDKEILPRIFDPFFTTKHMGVGTGMGLASVFGIIDNHGGFITVDSPEGGGSLFCVYLPALANNSNESDNR
jgi:signal transduction histidine kinase